MKLIGMAATLLLLSAVVLGAQNALTATIPQGADSFRAPNCNNVDGPSKQRVVVTIENPLPEYMIINYYQYNLSSGEWESKGRLCTAPGEQLTQCPVDVLVTAGNQGNISVNRDMLRIVGTAESSPDTYEKTFSFSITHYTAEREAALLSQLAGNSTALTTAQAQCSAKPACCSQELSGKLSDAEAEFTAVSASINGCHLVDAYNSLVMGERNVKNVTQTLARCTLSGTPTPTPGQGTPTPGAGTPTPVPIQSQTPPPQTPAPTPTPAPASSCPVGVVLLLLGAACLVAAKR